MTPRESLLRVILDDPTSDAARLVYADHLEETGEAARAEFIRVQVELAKMPPARPLIRLVDASVTNEFRDPRPSENPLVDFYFESSSTLRIVGHTDPSNLRYFAAPSTPPPLGTLVSQMELVDVEVNLNGEPKSFACHFVRASLSPLRPLLPLVEFVQLPRFNPETQAIEYPPPFARGARRRHLEGRERELLAGRDYEWFFPRGVLSEPAQWTFRRGFVASITLTAADWLDHADALLACQPIEEVTLTTLPDFVSHGATPEGCWHYLNGRRSMKPIFVPFPALQNNVAATLLHAIWPRVAFTLPQAIDARWEDRPQDVRRHAESLLGYESPRP